MFIAILFSVITIIACEDYPCRPIPWNLPQFPALQSPTPLSVGSGVTATYTPTGTLTATPTGTLPATPTPTPTPAPATPTLPFNPDEVNDSVATLQALLGSTPIFEAFPTADFPPEVEQFFSYSKGLSTNFGPFEPLFTLFLLGASLTIGLTIATALFPFVISLIGLIRRLIQWLVDLIPFW